LWGKDLRKKNSGKGKNLWDVWLNKKNKEGLSRGHKVVILEGENSRSGKGSLSSGKGPKNEKAHGGGCGKKN